MRLPLRHSPAAKDPPLRRCAHLELLAEQLVGVPLGPAASLLPSQRSRGRYGNALQWHLGLPWHDGDARLDWEDRIEVKLVSVWRRPGGEAACDKIKVCDLSVDPWHKLANVLWIFTDRLTRVVIGAAFFHLVSDRRRRLEAAWGIDPHFGQPALFVEARDQGTRSAPAYYLSSRWFVDEGLLPRTGPPLFEFDSRWWNKQRREHGLDPLATLVQGAGSATVCPRCQGPLRYSERDFIRSGWAPAWHGMPLGDACAVRGHFVVDETRLRMSAIQSQQEFRLAVEGAVPRDRVWRLADRVEEPIDHLHEG